MKEHSPTDEELEVQRVRLVKPFINIDLMSATLNDYAGLIKKQSWCEISSDFRSQDEEVNFILSKFLITGFKFVASLSYLYTIVDNMMFTWPLRHILDLKSGNSHLSMCVTSFKPF